MRILLRRRQQAHSNTATIAEGTTKALHRSQSSVRLSACLACFSLLAVVACGCTGVREYVHNGFKVGPNYGRPPAPIAHDWLEANDQRVRQQSDDISRWWTVFNDPTLDSMICFAYRQNLTLRQAGFRVLEARAQLAIDRGNLLPQTQQLTGNFEEVGLSRETSSGKNLVNRTFSQWNFGFNLNWELDFWGKFRRTIESDEATLNASVENYDDALVTMLSDIAADYIQLRTTQQRIKYARSNVCYLQATLRIAEGRQKVGAIGGGLLDVDQAKSTLEQTLAEIFQLRATARQFETALATLLGIPAIDLPSEVREPVNGSKTDDLAFSERFNVKDDKPNEVKDCPDAAALGKIEENVLAMSLIPTAPIQVAVGIPADLLRRRPDVRAAERQAAAQCAKIGVAESELYPALSLTGILGLSAENLSGLFRSQALNGTVAPGFAWNILNYGRIKNNVRLQDAKFQELIANYQQVVLAANQDVENGLGIFLNAQENTSWQAESVKHALGAVKIAMAQYQAGTIDLTRLSLLQQTLVQQQDVLAQAEGQIALGLIQVYKALGGGWQLRLTGCRPMSPNQVGPAPVSAPNATQPPKFVPAAGDWKNRRQPIVAAPVASPNQLPQPMPGPAEPAATKYNFLPPLISPAKPVTPDATPWKPAVPEINLVPMPPPNVPSQKDEVPKTSTDSDTIWKGVDR